VKKNAALPLVSCVMATHDRLSFLKQALRCFARQSYAPRELIVVDDGARSAAALCRGREGVRHLRLETPASLGAKLNLGIEQARGTILQKLDDDDYYGPGFLEAAAGHLLRAGRASSLVAWDCFLLLLAGERQLRYSGESWAAGGTFCFHRCLWERAPFRDAPRAVDTWFLRDHRPEIIRVRETEQYICVRHGANTWVRMPDGEPVDDFLRRFPVYPRPWETVLGPVERRFYARVGRAPSPARDAFVPPPQEPAGGPAAGQGARPTIEKPPGFH
jgi:glycosyltransferase involved in cell wall biosynthesis